MLLGSEGVKLRYGGSSKMLHRPQNHSPDLQNLHCTILVFSFDVPSYGSCSAEERKHLRGLWQKHSCTQPAPARCLTLSGLTGSERPAENEIHGGKSQQQAAEGDVYRHLR